MNWNIDSSHTSIQMSVKHMGMFTVRGAFDKVSGRVETTESGELKYVEAVIDAASINTRDANRDAHLRNDDFLAVDKYPTLTFRSTDIQKQDKHSYLVTGDFTIRDRTNPVTLQVRLTDPIRDPYGLLRAGAEVTGSLSRKQWGLTWNAVIETGALMVSDEVKFTVDVEAVAEAPQEAAAELVSAGQSDSAVQ